ncbi:T7 exonuclease [Sphingomonas paeninsulae]|uniref:T7 exonuclease n=1 Tax=Sphingomonas paeninsulae TaxID=2319844 RepID=A0A494TIA7_SPHPE|nr:T7 exonuclease [Sphingomonas paeninsulae]AYJ85521.1 T7 exonuclease [Sphingomonas paeninsulae]
MVAPEGPKTSASIDRSACNKEPSKENLITQLLIDGDLFLFKAVAAAEYEADWGDGIFVASTNVKQAQDMVISMIDSVKTALNSDDIVIVLSGSKNFRYTVDPSYKSNRKSRKPLGYKALTTWIYETYPGKVISQDILEADDYLGILATKPGAIDRIIVSDDKDLKTIPGRLFRMSELSTIDEDQADRYWWSQVLTGDATDGYKGCPGVGPVKAEAILSKPGDRWENVRQAYLKAGLTTEDAVLQARLARILHFDDWDTATKSVRLWAPQSA